MDQQNFWQEKWQQNETMWKGENVNDVLKDFLPTLQKDFGISPPAEALVPLCGDSPAVRLLYDAGYSVTGVEYVPQAMRSLIENAFPEITFNTKDSTWSAPRLALVLGDFFKFSAPERFSFVYDRAGYVALSIDDRPRYAEVITTALRPGGILLTRTAEFIGAPWKEAPPHSVTFEEVASSFKTLRVNSHVFEDVTPTNRRYIEAGITTIRHLTCAMAKP